MTTKDNTYGLSYAREIYVKVLGEKVKVNDEGDRLKNLSLIHISEPTRPY